MGNWVTLTELGERRCTAIKIKWSSTSNIDDSGSYNFTREYGVEGDEWGIWGSNFRFDLTAENVCDANINGGSDTYYRGLNAETYQGEYNGKEYYITYDGEYVQWEWTEPVYYYGFNGKGDYDPEPVAADFIYVMLEGAEEPEIPEEPDVPPTPEEPEIPEEPDVPPTPEEPITIADNLNRIIQAKADIKVAIENKGVVVGDITIDGYANKIAEIEGGGVSDTTLEKNAIVLDVTKNGTYYTQYADLPEPVYTGDDGFRGYASMTATGPRTGSLNTNYIGDEYTVVELWFRHFGNNSGDNSIVQRYEWEGSYKLMVNGYNGILAIGNSRYEFTLPTGEFLHIKFSNNGLWLNDELVLDNLPLYTVSKTNKWEIGGAGNCGIGDYGMIKIDDNVYIPTENGFINQSTGEVLPNSTNETFAFTYNEIIPPFTYNNLIKQVNVNAKINVHESQIKLAYYSNTTIPEWLDFSNISKEDLTRFFQNSSISSLNGLENIDTSNLTSLNNTFYYCNNLLDISPINNWNVSKVTNMANTFSYCNKLTSLDLSNWNVSKVTDMDNMFRSCSNITSMDLSNWESSKVARMGGMFDSCSKLETLSSINCGGITGTDSNGAGMFGYGGLTSLKNFGGWIGLKKSVTNYGINKCPNLTYESCINVLNGLYDFTGNGITPASNEGKLKVHQNFLDLVGDEIRIGTDKGWTISV